MSPANRAFVSTPSKKHWPDGVTRNPATEPTPTKESDPERYSWRSWFVMVQMHYSTFQRTCDLRNWWSEYVGRNAKARLIV